MNLVPGNNPWCLSDPKQNQFLFLSTMNLNGEGIQIIKKQKINNQIIPYVEHFSINPNAHCFNKQSYGIAIDKKLNQMYIFYGDTNSKHVGNFAIFDYHTNKMENQVFSYNFYNNKTFNKWQCLKQKIVLFLRSIGVIGINPCGVPFILIFMQIICLITVILSMNQIIELSCNRSESCNNKLSLGSLKCRYKQIEITICIILCCFYTIYCWGYYGSITQYQLFGGELVIQIFQSEINLKFDTCIHSLLHPEMSYICLDPSVVGHILGIMYII